MSNDEQDAVQTIARTIQDRVTRLETWREADRERMATFEAEMRSHAAAVQAQLTSISGTLSAIQTALATRAGSDAARARAVSFLGGILGGSAGWVIGQLAWYLFRSHKGH